MRALLGIALTFVVLACTGSDRPPDSFSVADSAGVAIATNGAVGAWPADSVWRLVEDHRIVGSDDDPRHQWGWISAAAVNSRQELHLLDLQNRHVQVYDSTGQWLRAIGGPGAGPGEIGPSGSTVGTVLIGADDSVVVVDMGNMRVNHYSPAGVPARSHPIPLAIGSPYRFGMLPDGTLIEQTQVVLRSDSGHAPVSVLVTFDGTGGVADTVLALPGMPALDLRGGVGGVATRIHDAKLYWDVAHDGRIAVGVSSAYEIRIHDGSGSLQRIIRRGIPARSITGQERQWLLAPMLGAFDQQIARSDSAAGAVIRRMRDNVSVAEVYPHFGSLLFGPEGRLLVGQIGPPADPDAPPAPPRVSRDVFDSDGRFLGVLDLPSGFRVLTATPRAVYAIRADDEGRQVVVRLVPY